MRLKSRTFFLALVTILAILILVSVVIVNNGGVSGREERGTYIIRNPEVIIKLSKILNISTVDQVYYFNTDAIYKPYYIPKLLNNTDCMRYLEKNNILYNKTIILLNNYINISNILIKNNSKESYYKFLILLDSYYYYYKNYYMLKNYPTTNTSVRKWSYYYCMLNKTLTNLDGLALKLMKNNKNNYSDKLNNSIINSIIEKWRKSKYYNKLYDYREKRVSAVSTFVKAEYDLSRSAIANTTRDKACEAYRQGAPDVSFIVRSAREDLAYRRLVAVPLANAMSYAQVTGLGSYFSESRELSLLLSSHNRLVRLAMECGVNVNDPEQLQSFIDAYGDYIVYTAVRAVHPLLLAGG